MSPDETGHFWSVSRLDLDDLRDGVRRRWHSPVFWNDVLQLVKTAVAALLAWVLAARVLDLPQAFLAPWSALLVVHANVYRTLSHGVRQVVATLAGILLAWAVGEILGLDPLSVAVVLLVGLALGSLSWFTSEEQTFIAATAIIVLTTGFAQDDTVLLVRLVDSAVGIVVGLLVNTVVWPPLRRSTAVAAMEAAGQRIGELLCTMHAELQEEADADTVHAWIEETRRLDGSLDEAWALVRQAQESAWLNPRRSARGVRRPEQWFALLTRMEQSVAEIRSMARTIGRAVARDSLWDEDFRAGWVELLGAAGDAVRHSQADLLANVRDQLDDVVRTLQDAEQLSRHWPQYGALLLNLRNVVDTLGDVAAAAPLDRPAVTVRHVGAEDSEEDTEDVGR